MEEKVRIQDKHHGFKEFETMVDQGLLSSSSRVFVPMDWFKLKESEVTLTHVNGVVVAPWPRGQDDPRYDIYMVIDDKGLQSMLYADAPLKNPRKLLKNIDWYVVDPKVE